MSEAHGQAEGGAAAGGAAAVEAAAAGGLLNGASGGSGGGFDWKGALGDQYDAFKPTIEAKAWKGPADAVKAYTEAQKLIGADKVAIPGKNAKPEEVAAFWGRLGRPESPDKYAFPKIDGKDVNPEAVKPWASLFHSVNMPQPMAEQLFAQATKLVREHTATERAELERATATMRAQIASEFGDKFNAAQIMAKRAAAAAGLTEEDTAAIYKAGPGVERAMFRILARLGEGIREDTMVSGEGSGMSAADAQAEINKLYGDKDFMAAYKERSHPQHKDAVTKMEQLFKSRFPSDRAA